MLNSFCSFIRPSLLACALLPTLASAASTWQITEFSLPGYTNTWLWDINDSGQIVGSARNGSDSVGFIHQNGVTTILNAPGGQIISATGISNSGLIVGNWFNPSDRVIHGYLQDHGVFSSFVVPGSTTTTLRHVSSDGRYLTGTYEAGSPDFQSGFVFDRQTSTWVRFESNAVDNFYLVQGVNSAGLVTGTVYDNTGVRSFVYDMNSGSQNFYADPAGTGTARFRDINDQGSIVGFRRDSAIVGTPAAGFETFSFAGAFSTTAYGNNNHGDMVGYFYTSPTSSDIHSFIALSVPEPASYALMLGGLTAMLAGLGRRNGGWSNP